ncbi:MAG: hypothetical protein NTX59_08375 [Elusimicrobia bacterium]|nr:hypothetical protein [Elusimicrobiota bacterium]
MHKDIQDNVCFWLGRRMEDNVEDRITLYDIFFTVMIFVDIYALDAAAHQLALILVKR